VQGTPERSIPASKFFVGYRQVDLQPHEVLYKVRCSHTTCCTR
jgi:xanthine dehydrogenase/oxidase